MRSTSKTVGVRLAQGLAPIAGEGLSDDWQARHVQHLHPQGCTRAVGAGDDDHGDSLEYFGGSALNNVSPILGGPTRQTGR